MAAPPGLGNPADPNRLPAVLALTNPRRFFDEFSGFAAHFYSQKLERWPPLFRMYHVLMELDIAVNIDDISGFFLEHEYRVGGYAHEAATFLRKIGAPKTAEFVAAAIALFPNAEVPKEFAKRERLTERLLEQEPNPFAALNKKYKGTLRPMYATVQEHMRVHERELRDALEKAQRGVRGKKPKWLTLDTALRQKTPRDRIAGGAPQEHAALMAVSDRIQERLKAGGFDRLTRGERLFHVVWFVMDAEITNGGIHQFLWNSSGDFAEEAKRHLGEIGASRVAAPLHKAGAAFPRGVIPATQKARQHALGREKKLGDRVENDWDELDREYRRAAQRELYSKLLRWVREHASEFPDPA